MPFPALARLAALTFTALLCAQPGAHAQGAFGGFDGDEFRKLSPDESAKVLANFRNHRQPGVSRLRFVITHAERRSDDETRYAGELVSAWDAAGMVSRIELNREGAPADQRRSFLIRGGQSPALWTLGADGKPVRADAEALKPLHPGLVFTPYDLQLPFIHWRDAKYRETARFRATPTDYFRMTPDATFRTAHPEVGSVLLGFTRAYSALVRAETVDAKGRTLRDLRAESFGKLQGQWIIREMQLRDGVTRATDTLTVKSAALNRALPPEVFTPEGLAAALPAENESAYAPAD